MTILRDKISVKIQIGIAFVLWCYIIYRALFISITQDEAHSYLLVKTYNWKQALTTTNTHWLNSFFMRIFLYLPGKDYLWKLRMFSVLSWIVYSFSVIRIGYYFKDWWMSIAFFIVAILNPYLIFYFSLARGYAAACAFIMLSLVMAAKHIQVNEIRPRRWLNVFLAASIAILANFSALYFFIGLTATFFLYLLVNKKLNLVFSSSSRPWLILVIGALGISFGALFLIRTINELFFPGHSNVIDSLFGSLIKSISYFDVDRAAYYRGGVGYLLNEDIPGIYKSLGIAVALFFVMASLHFAWQFSKTREMSIGFWALLSGLGIMLTNIFLHIVSKTPYLFERAALIFYPPLVVGLFFSFEAIENISLLVKRVVKGMTTFLIIIFFYNFFKSFSLAVLPDWPIQANTKDCLDYLKISEAKLIGMNVWHYSVFKNYYTQAYPGMYNFSYQIISDKAQTDSLDSNLLKFDYLLLAPPYDSTLTKNWEIKLRFPESGAIILKRKSKSGLPDANPE